MRNQAAGTKGSRTRQGSIFDINKDIDTVLASKYRSRGAKVAPVEVEPQIQAEATYAMGDTRTVPLQGGASSEESLRTATVEHSLRTKPSEAAVDEPPRQFVLANAVETI